MPLNVFIFFTVIYSLVLIWTSAFIIFSFSIYMDKLEKDKPASIPSGWFSDSLIFMVIGYCVILFIFFIYSLSIEISTYNFNKLGSYLTSDLSIIMLLSAIAITAAICIFLTYKNGWAIILKLIHINNKMKIIERNKRTLEESIDDLKDNINNCKNEQTKDVYKKSLNALYNEYNAYCIRMNQYEELYTMLDISLSERTG